MTLEFVGDKLVITAVRESSNVNASGLVAMRMSLMETDMSTDVPRFRRKGTFYEQREKKKKIYKV